MTKEVLDNFILRGKKHLYNDSYERITIEKNKINYEVTVNKDENKNTNGILVQKLYELTPYDRVMTIIDHYLRTNSITEIQTNKKIRCLSSTNRVLYIRTINTSFKEVDIDRICSMINYKYNLDRKSFLEENNYIENYKVILKDSNSGYSINDDEIIIKLCSDDGIICENEKEFLYSFLYNLMCDATDIKICTYKWNEFNMDIACFEVHIDNIIINFKNYNEELKQIVYNVIEECKEQTLVRRNELWKK